MAQGAQTGSWPWARGWVPSLWLLAWPGRSDLTGDCLHVWPLHVTPDGMVDGAAGSGASVSERALPSGSREPVPPPARPGQEDPEAALS